MWAALPAYTVLRTTRRMDSPAIPNGHLSEELTMKKTMAAPTMSMRVFEKRADQILAELQKTLLPEHASEVIGINVDTGEYVLAPDSHEAWEAFLKRWPGTLGFVVRVDGGPVVKFHGR